MIHEEVHLPVLHPHPLQILGLQVHQQAVLAPDPQVYGEEQGNGREKGLCIKGFMNLLVAEAQVLLLQGVRRVARHVVCLEVHHLRPT